MIGLFEGCVVTYLPAHVVEGAIPHRSKQVGPVGRRDGMVKLADVKFVENIGDNVFGNSAGRHEPHGVVAQQCVVAVEQPLNPLVGTRQKGLLNQLLR